MSIVYTYLPHIRICTIGIKPGGIRSSHARIYRQASARAMEYLTRGGTLVYLRAGLELLERRIDDYDRRGIANPPGQSFAEIFAERTPLYQRQADVTVDGGGRTPAEVAAAVVETLGTFRRRM